MNIYMACGNPGALYVATGQMGRAETMTLRSLPIPREGGWIAHDLENSLSRLAQAERAGAT